MDGPCRACGQRGSHYVPSVGHLTPPEDAIEPYYTCTGEEAWQVERRRAAAEAGR